MSHEIEVEALRALLADDADLAADPLGQLNARELFNLNCVAYRLSTLAREYRAEALDAYRKAAK